MPFSPAELVARVGLALRRRIPPAPFVLGDRAKRRVTLAGRPLRLTATEYRLLHALSLDAGGATTYESLLRRVWGRAGRRQPNRLRSSTTGSTPLFFGLKPATVRHRTVLRGGELAIEAVERAAGPAADVGGNVWPYASSSSLKNWSPSIPAWSNASNALVARIM